MIKNIFSFVGIYTTIANAWRAYEYARYKKITPKYRDTLIAIILAIVVYQIIS